MHTRAALLGLLWTAAAVMPLCAQQYREGMPAVMTPTPKAEAPALDEDRVARDFRAAYVRRHSPRIAVFWNREFTDQLSQWIGSQRVVVASQGSVVGGYGSRKLALKGSEQSAVYAESRQPDNPRQQMAELPAAEFETGFMEPFIAAGAKVVDRAATMRLARHKERGELGTDQVADPINVETAALVGYADLLAEVLMIHSPDAPLGVKFRVNLKDIKTGQIVQTILTPAKPPKSGEREWEATSEGYAEKPEPPAMPDKVGRQLAFETMTAMARVWR
jgi:hypothetical protein